jgi:transcriptional regulator with XRE-family HTH domain
MMKVRALVKKSGLTQQVIGEKMGYDPKSARQSVSQFLKSEDPTLRVVGRFAKAMGVSVEDLL